MRIAEISDNTPDPSPPAPLPQGGEGRNNPSLCPRPLGGEGGAQRRVRGLVRRGIMRPSVETALRRNMAR
ncbi:hypothetical protein SBA2_320038 [Acidobacteriia bacterium SbA2]|nr:hypothetical protein SBA2_320038 [Acidobacteriia bacterium SbA2]